MDSDRTDVAQQVGCLKCGTILNAEAAACDGPWHADNRPASEPPSLLDIASASSRAQASHQEVARLIREHAYAAGIEKGWRRALATLSDVADRTGSVSARYWADYLTVDPDRRMAKCEESR